MSNNLPSSWNATDSTYHVSPDDKIELRKEVLRFIFCSTWLGVLISVALAFLTLSTASQRRAPLFALQALGFTLAIVYNTCEIVYSLTRFEATFTLPESGQGSSYDYLIRLKVLDLTLEHVVPIICDSALLIKVHSFFPYPIYSRRKQLAVLGPMIVLLLPRISLTIVASYAVWRMETDVQMVPGQTYPVDMGYRWVPLVQKSNQAEFTVQAFYCLYAAAVLLRKAIQFTLGYTNPLSRLSIRRRMRFFLEALLMTFIPPIAFATAAAGTIQCDSGRYCYFREMSGTLLNTSVLFGLLATTWSSIRARHSDRFADDMVFKSPSQLHGMTLPRSFLAQTFPSADTKSDSEKGLRGSDEYKNRSRTAHPFKMNANRGHIGRMGRTSSGFFDFDGKNERDSSHSEEKEDLKTILACDPAVLRRDAMVPARMPYGQVSASQEIMSSGDATPRRLRREDDGRDTTSPGSMPNSPDMPAEPDTCFAPSEPLQPALPLLQQVWKECRLEPPQRRSQMHSRTAAAALRQQSIVLRPAFFDSSEDEEPDSPFSNRHQRQTPPPPLSSSQTHRHSHRRQGSSLSCPVHGHTPTSASSVQFATPPANAKSCDEGGSFEKWQRQSGRAHASPRSCQRPHRPEKDRARFGQQMVP